MFADKAPWFVTILKLNPFYYVVAGYRDSMLTGNWFWERAEARHLFLGGDSGDRTCGPSGI